MKKLSRSMLFFWMIGGSMLNAPAASAQPDNWYKCNTHMHTNAAGPEVSTSLADAVEWYRTHGYQCVVVTDHEHVADVRPLAEKYAASGDAFLVMTGQEIGQAIKNPSKPWEFDHYHINGLNISSVIWPIGHPKRVDPNWSGSWDESVPEKGNASAFYRQLIDEIYAQGGVPQINHPNLFWTVKPQDVLPIERPFLLEVWNGVPGANNLGGTEDGELGLGAEQLWDVLLSAGKIVYGTATDDTHDYVNFDQSAVRLTPGKAWIVVRAPQLTKAEFNKALLEGRFYASNGIPIDDYTVDDQRISISIGVMPNGDWPGGRDWPGNRRFVTRFIGQGGTVLAEVPGPNPSYAFKGDETYVRASILDSDGRRAWTQPVFRDGRVVRQRK